MSHGVVEQLPNDSRSSPSPRSHAQNPSIQQEGDDGKSETADDNARGFVTGANQRERRCDAREYDDRRDYDTNDAFTDDQAGCEQDAELLGRLRLRRAIGATFEDVTNDCADHN